jgi:hypothetical protein
VDDVWVQVIGAVLVPIVVRVVVHYLPWLAEDPFKRPTTDDDVTGTSR